MDFSEFMTVMAKRTATNPHQDMKEMFRIFDKDHSGFIYVSEFREVLQKIGALPEEEIEEMIRMSDLDGDGRVDYQGR